jgi:Ca-activated chloride channel family protein
MDRAERTVRGALGWVAVAGLVLASCVGKPEEPEREDAERTDAEAPTERDAAIAPARDVEPEREEASTKPAEAVGGEEPGEPEVAPVPEGPKLASVRDRGVAREPAGDPSKGLSEHALAFYKSLGKIAQKGEVEHPSDTPAVAQRRRAGGGGPRGGALSRWSMAKSARRAPARSGAAPAAPVGVTHVFAYSSTVSADAAKLGVTTGGMQDIGQARKIIDSGRVPSPEMFATEGLLSEHDIPLDGLPSGEADLYASASVAWTRRYGEREPVAVVQLGFGVDMDIAAFERPPLNLAVVVDVSGSMQGGKIEAVRKSLARLLGQLGPADRVAVVLFNNTAWVPLPSRALGGAGIAAARDICSKIAAGGGTSIESGLRLGYEQVAAHLDETAPGGAKRSARVFLMTDAQPNVGATTAGAFKPMMQGAAARGIGLTAFGVGLDFGQALAYEIFQTRGANYFYLENEAKISKCFDEEFIFMVTPAAYDVLVMMVPAEGAEVVDVLGVPDYEKGAEGVELRIPSLFFSKREGGGASLVALRLAAPELANETDVATVDLSFLPVGSAERVRQRIDVFLPAGLDAKADEAYYSQPGAKKALVLASAVTALKAACRGQRAPRSQEALWTVNEPGRGGDLEITLSPDDAARSAEGLGAFADWFATRSAGFPALEAELRLLEKLEATLRSTGGLPALGAPRAVPAEGGPETSPPEVDVF